MFKYIICPYLHLPSLFFRIKRSGNDLVLLFLLSYVLLLVFSRQFITWDGDEVLADSFYILRGLFVSGHFIGYGFAHANVIKAVIIAI